MEFTAERTARAAELTALFSELYSLSAEPEMLGHRFDIMQAVDALCADHREAVLRSRGSRPGIAQS